MRGDQRLTATDEDRVTEDLPEGERESAFAWEWRVMVVSAVWAMPGVLLGALARVCVPDGGPASWWLVGGAAVEAVLGGLLEADHLLG